MQTINPCLINTSLILSTIKKFNFRNSRETLCLSSKETSSGRRERNPRKRKERRNSRRSLLRRKPNWLIFMVRRSMSVTMSFSTLTANLLEINQRMFRNRRKTLWLRKSMEWKFSRKRSLLLRPIKLRNPRLRRPRLSQVVFRAIRFSLESKSYKTLEILESIHPPLWTLFQK